MLSPDFSIFPELRSDRLLLRQISDRDLAQAYKLRSDPEVYKHLSRPPEASVNDTQAFLQRVYDNLASGNGIQWAMCLRGDEKMIGTIGIWRIVKQHYRGEVGYLLLPEHQGQGLMAEAIEAVVNYGFYRLGLHSLEARTNIHNIASQKVLERNGFVREALFRENIFYDDAYTSTVVYSLLNPLK